MAHARNVVVFIADVRQFLCHAPLDWLPVLENFFVVAEQPLLAVLDDRTRLHFRSPVPVPRCFGYTHPTFGTKWVQRYGRTTSKSNVYTGSRAVVVFLHPVS